MKHIAKINADLIAAGVPVSGVSALHDTVTRALIVCGGSQAYRIDFDREPTDDEMKTATAAVIAALPGGAAVHILKTRNRVEREAADKVDAEERARAIRAQEASDTKALADAASAKRERRRRQ